MDFRLGVLSSRSWAIKTGSSSRVLVAITLLRFVFVDVPAPRIQNYSTLRRVLSSLALRLRVICDALCLAFEMAFFRTCTALFGFVLVKPRAS